MDNNVAAELTDDLANIKQKYNMNKKIDIWSIIRSLSKYRKDDLILFKDCIDFVLIYNKHK